LNQLRRTERQQKDKPRKNPAAHLSQLTREHRLIMQTTVFDTSAALTLGEFYLDPSKDLNVMFFDGQRGDNRKSG
jgi:hypothetical protein